jgi:hypothetical protein
MLQASNFTGSGEFGAIGILLSMSEYRITEIYDRVFVMEKQFVKPVTCPSTTCQ